MPAVTRLIRGARRTGRGLGCAQPKCRCGFYRVRRSALRLPLFFWRQTLSCSGLAKLGRKDASRERSCFIRPRAKRGGGGPREARWKGSSFDAWFSLQELRCGQKASQSWFHDRRTSFVEACAPSTALRAVPLPRSASLRGGG